MNKNINITKDYIYKLGGFEKSDKLDLQMEALIYECLAYCYRSDITEAMVIPLADVVANEIKKRELLGVEGDVSSYSEGDMSITFGTANTSNGKSFYNGKLEPFKLVIGAINDV